MNYNVQLSEESNKELKAKIEGLSMVYDKSAREILEIGILTYIAMETLPNYKNYESIVTGRTQARMMKGVNGRSKVESQVKKLLETYELEEVNKFIIEKAVELVIITFDSIFTKSGEKVQEKYRKALLDKEFLYINLRLAVKIIAESLRQNNVDLSNKTLHYITDGIKKEKRSIAKAYIEAYVNDDPDALKEAREHYRERMEVMLQGYIKTLQVPYNDIEELAMEKKIMEKLGPEALENFTSYLLADVREKIEEDHRMQMVIDFA